MVVALTRLTLKLKHPLIHISRFQAPLRPGRGPSLPLIDDIRQDYWLGVRLGLANFGWKLAKRYNRLLTKGAVVALYGGLFIPFSTSSHVIYEPVSPPQQVISLKTLEPIKAASYKPLEPLETLAIPLAAPGTYANAYAPGNCTWGVASRVQVPNTWGNAINWGYAALSAGYTVSAVPKVGAIAWSTTDSYLGHVALVTAVNGNNVTIWEENGTYGLFTSDERLASPNEFRYIYI